MLFRSKADCELKAFTLKDGFIHDYGSHAELLKAHGLDAGLILERLRVG